ncbi:MAG: CHY zinc finger protein [Bacteroidales bacterium]
MSQIEINGITVYGIEIDRHTRCQHYHSDIDIIAIRLKCCNRYYACNSCHNAMESHDIIPWPETEFNEKAVLCGMCGHELTINEYLKAKFSCPQCGSNFNPNCSKHYSIYFGISHC